MTPPSAPSRRPHPPRRGIALLLAAVAAGGVAVTTGGVAVAAAGVRAGPVAAAPAEPEPAASSPTATDPPPPPPPPPSVEVDAADVTVGPGYWQGAAESYRLALTVRNTGAGRVTTSTEVELPAGVRAVAATPGPCTGGDGTFACALDAGASATVQVQVAVAPDVWRDPPTGAVRTTGQGPSGTASDEDAFALVFPPGPPTPGIGLTAADAVLPPTGDGRPEIAWLEVRLRNTGAAQSPGAVELTTPAGVQVATMPAQCAGRARDTPTRERCDLGRVTAGQEVVLAFALAVRPEARASAPMRGTVHATLAPAGQDQVTVQATYRIVVGAGGATQPAAPIASRDPAGRDQPDRTIRGGHTTVSDGMDVGRQLSVLPIIASIVGLFTVVVVMVILSLRRRLHHDPPQPAHRPASPQLNEVDADSAVPSGGTGRAT